jgi:hypothetical protein
MAAFVRFGLLLLGLLVVLGEAATDAGAAPARWVHLRPNASPPPAAEDPMAFDAATGQMVLLDTVNGGTWTWDGSTWTPQTPGTTPSARAGAVMAYDAATKQLILFGGQAGPNLVNETWTWTGSNWVNLSPANSPPALADASLAYDPATGQLLLFGGSLEFGPTAETWSWDGSTWTQLTPATSPSARSQAAMAYDPASSQLLLFGGASEETPLGDTWSWTGSNWVKLSPATSPSPRVAPALAYDSATRQLLLQNGVGGTGTLNDQWAWNGSTWVKQRQLSAVSPTRDGRSMAYDPTSAQLVLFGGGTNGGPNLGDTWVWAPLSVQTASLPAGAVGVRYSARLQAISGTAPYTWSISGGALPAGLAMSPAGVISGTPTASGIASFTVTAVDAAQPTPAVATRVYSLQVFAAPKAAVWVGNAANSNVNAFSLTANGDTAPLATLSGPLTGLNGIGALAFDKVGELWAASANNDALERFAPGATGNVAPSEVVNGPNTGLVTPSGIAVDSTNRLYVSEAAANSLAIFPAGATGNTPPLATISGPDTGLSTPTGISISGGKLWAANQGNATLTAYPLTASGDQAPSVTIGGQTTQLNHPAGLGLDSSGHLLVANFFGASVLKFALAGPFGDVAPQSSLGGSDAQLSLPQAVDTDTAGHVYVADENGGLNVYTATGTKPIAVINGPTTGLRAPGSVAVAPPLNLTTRTLPRAALGHRYAQRLWAILGQAPLRWRLVRGHLPHGLKLTRAGRVLGVARQLGRFHLTVSVTDSERDAQTARAGVTLVVAHRPTVTHVRRTRGSRRGGARVTITGTGFATAPGATAVSFGAMHALRVRCRSEVRCKVRTPPGRPGIVAVTVTVNGLVSQRSPHARYRFTR